MGKAVTMPASAESGKVSPGGTEMTEGRIKKDSRASGFVEGNQRLKFTGAYEQREEHAVYGS